LEPITDLNKLQPLLHSDARRISAFSIMGASENTATSPSRGKIVIASPIGDAHALGRLVIHAGAEALGFTVLRANTIGPKNLADLVRASKVDAVVMTWLLSPSGDQIADYLEYLAAVPTPPLLLMGGLTVNTAWIEAHVTGHYPGKLIGCTSAAALLRELSAV